MLGLMECVLYTGTIVMAVVIRAEGWTSWLAIPMVMVLVVARPLIRRLRKMRRVDALHVDPTARK